ncbi:MAG: plastocyanin/azurin family copper-binding protein [Halobacteriales archaeon]
MADDLNVDIHRSQLRLGVLAGVAAYVVGFLAMFLPGSIANPRAYPPEEVVNETLTESEFNPSDGGTVDVQQFPLTETIDPFNSAAGVFYNAHFVDILAGFQRRPALSRRRNVLLDEVTGDTLTVGVFGGEEAEIILAGQPVPPILFFLVPVVLLALGGILINELSGDTAPTPETAVTSGSAVVLGYLPLVTIVASIVRFREPRIIFGGIDFLGAVLVAGIIYPVVFGGLGGYVWFATRGPDDMNPETATESGSTTRRSRERSTANGGAAGASGRGGAPRDPSVERVAMTDDLAFEPETVTIAPGDAVRWENEGSLTFTVTAYEETMPRGVEYFASGRFDSEEAAREAYPAGGIESGESYEHVFDTPGTYEFFCVPQENAGMTGTVEVRED